LQAANFARRFNPECRQWYNRLLSGFGLRPSFVFWISAFEIEALAPVRKLRKPAIDRRFERFL